MDQTPHQRLAAALDALPNRFPATPDGSELRLLERLFTAEQADLAARLSTEYETPETIAARLGLDTGETRNALKGMARGGLIEVGPAADGLGFRLLPFVVGIYEMQVSRMDEQLARLFEDYFRQGFGEMLRVEPQVHRVIPVQESVRNDMSIEPFESAAALIDHAQSWGALYCICRKQKALLGDPCEHPLDVCMTFSGRPNAYDNNPVIRALTRDEALATLRRAADAGLVHSVSNSQDGVTYVCNCCTCSCGILRGMSELGIANAVARSAFVNTVDDLQCNGCGECLEPCQFDALTIDGIAVVDGVRCVGCGVCVVSCPNEAMALVRRPEQEILAVPADPGEWGRRRQSARGA